MEVRGGDIAFRRVKAISKERLERFRRADAVFVVPEKIRPLAEENPECNGVARRFLHTLKEECLYLHDFQGLEEAREVIGEFSERYNHGWLLERHGIGPRPKPVRPLRGRRRDQAAHLTRKPGLVKPTLWTCSRKASNAKENPMKRLVYRTREDIDADFLGSALDDFWSELSEDLALRRKLTDRDIPVESLTSLDRDKAIQVQQEGAGIDATAVAIILLPAFTKVAHDLWDEVILPWIKAKYGPDSVRPADGQ